MYRPEWQIQSDKFFEAFPAVEVLRFEVDRETDSEAAESTGRSSSHAGPSGVAGKADGAMAATVSSSLERPLRPAVAAQARPRAVDRITQAQANYEDIIAQRNACIAVRDRKLRRAERRRCDFYDSDSDETRAIEED